MPRTARVAEPSGRTLPASVAGKNDWLDDRRLTLYFVGEERRLQEKMDLLRKARKKMRQQAKLNGISLGELDEAVKESALDMEALTERYAAKIKYLRYLNVPIGSQLALFDKPQVEDKAPSETDKWFADGHRAAFFGSNMTDNPHEMNTPAGQAWQQGYLDGSSERARIQADLEAADAEKAPANDNGGDDGEPGDGDTDDAA